MLYGIVRLQFNQSRFNFASLSNFTRAGNFTTDLAVHTCTVHYSKA